MPASPGSNESPVRDWADWRMTAFTSSAVCCSSSSVGRTPNRRTTQFAILVRATVNGPLTVRNAASGRPSLRAVPSARVIARIFGTCSPSAMWIEVTRVKASATEIATATPCERPPKIGSIRRAREGSPRKPIPIEAIVIPT
jgi:hypothetical protein